MSVLDDVRGLEQRVIARLRELRPLIEEYEELNRIAGQLGLDPDAAPPSSPAPRRRSAGRSRKAAPKPAARTRPRTSTRRRAGGTRATGAERRARVLALIEQNPGISVPEIAKDIGVDPPPLYRVVRKLQSEGVIVKDGKELRRA